MSRRLLAIAAVVAVALPAVHRAEDWDDDDRYDVSVDLNVQGGASVDSFYGPLQPYGDWVVVGNYGQVWRPRVAAGWRPYYYGRWEWTNEGWFWASDEPWGWAAYHYGRWAYDPYYGWVWVPGSEWAPAWVSWRVSGDVVGWAPLAPGFSAYVTTYPFVDFWWTFVPSGRFCSVPVYSVAYAPTYARRWYGATTPAPAYVPRGAGRGGRATPAWGGPAPRLIEARVGRPLAPVRIVGAPSPGWRGRPGEIAVYRPERGFQGRPVGRGGAAAPPAFVGRGGEPRGNAPGGVPGFRGAPAGAPARAPELRGPPAGEPGFRGQPARAPELRGPPARAPEYRTPEAGHAGPRARGSFGGEPGGGRGWAPPAGGGEQGGGRGGWSPPAGGGGGAPHGGGNGGGHGRGERR